jgi:hypothetical protein
MIIVSCDQLVMWLSQGMRLGPLIVHRVYFYFTFAFTSCEIVGGQLTVNGGTFLVLWVMCKSVHAIFNMTRLTFNRE